VFLTKINAAGRRVVLIAHMAHSRRGCIVHIRFLLAACLLGLALSVGPGTAAAQPEEKRAALIMSMPASPLAFRAALAPTLYEDLARQSGQASRRLVLPLTRTELWSVPSRKVASLTEAAAKAGVRVNRLEADWNQLFRQMPAGMLTKRDMPPGRGSSGATGATHMMLPPQAAMMEYALTRDAGAASQERPAKIRLRLSANVILTLTRTSVEVGSDMCIWRGTVDGTGAPATIMWWPGVAMTGTVRHEGRIYSFRHKRGAQHEIAITDTNEAQMPPEHAPMPRRLRDPNLRDDPLSEQGDASTVKSLLTGLRDASPPVPQAREGRDKRSEPAKGMGAPPQASPMAGGPQDVTINVIVAYTPKVAASYGDVRRELAEFAIEEANQSFRNSKLGFVRLKLVHAYQTDYVEEGEHFEHLWRFADRGDGYMDEIHGLREAYDADVAILIVDDPKGCGLATRVFADAEEAFAVVHHQCALLDYSVAHEIGHLIGARHELRIDKSLSPFPYGHGYVNGTKWRDIMSYKESCGGCPRLPVWSSPKLVVGGDRAGTQNEDNARVIAEQAQRVANFRSSHSRPAYIAGPGPATSASSTADQNSQSR
jgi:hypothetical protein